MSLTWIAVAAGVAAAVYLLVVLALVLLGRRADARAVAGFVPDCVVLFKRLLHDPRVPRSRKLLVALAVVYLASPIDLIPDFIPVAGQLDDAIIVAAVLRRLLRAGGDELLQEHWGGPDRSLALLRGLAGTPSSRRGATGSSRKP